VVWINYCAAEKHTTALSMTIIQLLLASHDHNARINWIWCWHL